LHILGERGALLEEMDQVLPALLRHEQPLELLRDARVTGVDRLRAAPRFDRQLGATEAIGLDGAELDQELQLLVLVGIAALEAHSQERADGIGQLAPRLVFTTRRQDATLRLDVVDVLDDRHDNWRRHPCARPFGGGADAQRQHATERAPRLRREREQIGYVVEPKRPPAAVADDERDGTCADDDRQHQRCSRKGTAQLLQERVDDGRTGSERSELVRARRSGGLEGGDGVARDT
jgi:hypothetical protein